MSVAPVPEPGDGPVVSLQQVSLRRDDIDVLESIDLVVHRGEALGVIGPNGGGKTSLLRVMLGLERPTAGEVLLFGQPLASFRDWERIAYIAQQATHFDPFFPASVEEVVLLGRVSRRGPFRWFSEEDRAAARWAIEVAGLQGYEGRRVGLLSGGEKQRVFIAKAIAAKPELLVLDEPTTGVDRESQRRFYELIRQMNREQGITIVLVSHDLGVVSAHLHRVVCLNRTLFFDGDPNTVDIDDILRRLYGGEARALAHAH
jgi:zinc transport system ATP-binding protein